MLRSRGNRSQRASESTEEQASSSSTSNVNYYGGYNTGYSNNSGGNNPMAGVSTGDAEGAFGPSYNKKYFPPPNQHQHQLNAQKGKLEHSRPKKSSFCFSTACLIVAFLLVSLIVLSGFTWYTRKEATRVQAQLAIVKHSLKHPDHAHHHRDMQAPTTQEAVTAINPQDLAELTAQQSKLQAYSTQLTTRTDKLQQEVAVISSQMESMAHENNNYKHQLQTLQGELAKKNDASDQLQRQFQEKHKGSNGGLVIPQPGPGLVQRVEVSLENTNIHDIDNLEALRKYVKLREDALWDKIDGLIEKTERQSHREVLEWFGPGPHKVEMEIEYPQYTQDVEPESWPRVRGILVIELAPLHLMPVAVNLFLQQVHHRLWNGCSFVVNAHHILQAGPHQFEKSSAYTPNYKPLLEKFERYRLYKMPFQEYHKDFPHEQWTLGFAGRPGGPDFYINKVNNSINHGPGGQAHHDLHEEADPCFGKIVEGIDIISQLNHIPKNHDMGGVLAEHVLIVDARVVVAKSEHQNHIAPDTIEATDSQVIQEIVAPDHEVLIDSVEHGINTGEIEIDGHNEVHEEEMEHEISPEHDVHGEVEHVNEEPVEHHENGEVEHEHFHSAEHDNGEMSDENAHPAEHNFDEEDQEVHRQAPGPSPVIF